MRRILVRLPKKYDRKSSLWETKKTSNWNYFLEFILIIEILILIFQRFNDDTGH